MPLEIKFSPVWAELRGRIIARARAIATAQGHDPDDPRSFWSLKVDDCLALTFLIHRHEGSGAVPANWLSLRPEARDGRDSGV